jgi:uncharacterized coiled-coil DUF342 family protein
MNTCEAVNALVKERDELLVEVAKLRAELEEYHASDLTPKEVMALAEGFNPYVLRDSAFDEHFNDLLERLTTLTDALVAPKDEPKIRERIPFGADTCLMDFDIYGPGEVRLYEVEE